MKTCLLFGFIWALAGAFLTLILYFTGFHSDPAKLGTANMVSLIAGLAITSTCISLGTKALRSETPSDKDFGYGAALWVGVRISFVASLISALFGYVYWAFINPALADVVVQDQITKLEARGVSGAQLEKAEAMTRAMAAPVPQTIFAIIGGVLFGTIISLIVAALLKRPLANTPPTI